jgi:hypothetical protein
MFLYDVAKSTTILGTSNKHVQELAGHWDFKTELKFDY